METGTIISVRNVSKKFRRYDSVGQVIKEILHPGGKQYHKEFWALRGVDFNIERGESVGIVGRNGSGKSTLLQIICGVLQPTSGSVEVKGRIAALLELGAGFHPEFSGRENVYMNGALMGLGRAQMDERFDQIAVFADIGDFIDQPVRTYSSGMFVRLAFAAAINVEPDILVVDEALGVGDEAFQRKCYARIDDLKKAGTTVIFVSHSATKVVELCDRTVLLDHGEQLLVGKPKEVVAIYQKFIYAPEERLEALREEIRSTHALAGVGADDDEEAQKADRDGAAADEKVEGSGALAYFDPGLVPQSTVYYESRGATIENPRITTVDGETVNVLVRGDEYIYTYDVKFSEQANKVRFGMMIKTITGFELGGMVSHTPADSIERVEPGALLSPKFRFRCSLLPGVYFLNSGVTGVITVGEEYLKRGVDLAMFRLLSETDSLVAGVVDFSSEQSTVIYEKKSNQQP